MSSLLHFRQVRLTPIQQIMVYTLDDLPQGHGFAVVTTCDISRFEAFEKMCRQERRRPPSFYAYVARCLGATLAERTELIASRYGNKFLVPSFVQAKIVLEMSTYDGSKAPLVFMFKDLGRRTLPDINREITTTFREARRNPIAPPQVRRLFVPEWAPLWWQRAVEKIRRSRPRERYARAQDLACVQLSSTSQWTGGHPGWGVQMFTLCAMSITLGGVSKRAVVVDDEVVPRLCVDIAITFDHDIVDGGPATRYVRILSDEIESGRLLEEYGANEGVRPTSTRSTAKVADESATSDLGEASCCDTSKRSMPDDVAHGAPQYNDKSRVQ